MWRALSRRFLHHRLFYFQRRLRAGSAPAQAPAGCSISQPFLRQASLLMCFYTALVFNSRETADNLKKSGAFVPGIRPGEQTARYIDKILTRLTLAGAIY